MQVEGKACNDARKRMAVFADKACIKQQHSCALVLRDASKGCIEKILALWRRSNYTRKRMPIHASTAHNAVAHTKECTGGLL